MTDHALLQLSRQWEWQQRERRAASLSYWSRAWWQRLSLPIAKARGFLCPPGSLRLSPCGYNILSLTWVRKAYTEDSL